MIKLTCPACSQVLQCTDDTMVEAQISCPTCQRQFPPSSANPVKLQDPAPAAPAAPPRPESDRIADMANTFGGFALLCAVGGGIAVFLGIVSLAGSAGSSNASDSGAVCWVAAGALFSLAVSLFLISQIIHVRALLARKP